jgi:hypothetical protein
MTDVQASRYRHDQGKEHCGRSIAVLLIMLVGRRMRTTNRITKFWLPWIATALWAAVARANAGTPLMWAGAFHLFFGNVALGIGEGWLLAVLFRKRWSPCVAAMIAANYLSAWVGACLFGELHHSLSVHLNNAWRWLWILVFAAYVLTLLLEWPFVAFCLRRSDAWLVKSVWGSLVVQSVSYVVIFGWYWAVSGTSLFRDVAIVDPAQLHAPKGTVVYFIAAEDGDVYALDLNRQERNRACRLGSRDRGYRLQAAESATTSGTWDLVARPEPTSGFITLLSNFATAVPSRTEPASGWEEWNNIGQVPRLGSAGESSWTFWSGFWPLEGLSGTNSDNGEQLHVSLETPFLQWDVRNATQLSDDQVVFQLGTDQICILDPNQRTISLIARGWGPVVVIADGRTTVATQVVPLP